MAIAFRSVGTFGSSATATSHNIPIQSGIVAGDFLIIAGGNRQISTQPTNVPTGWTVGSVSPTGAAHNLWTFYKIADGSEGGNVSDPKLGQWDRCAGWRPCLLGR